MRLSKLVYKIPFKKRAPRAIREIRKHVERVMSTKDVRIDTKLNKAIWANGIRNVPRRIRIRMSRKRNTEDDSFYTLVQHVHVTSFKELTHNKVSSA